MKKIGLIGGGSWGTALAVTLSNKGHKVNLWDISPKHIEDLKKDRENKSFLPGIKFGENLNPVEDQREALKNMDMIVFSAPAQQFRAAISKAKEYINPNTVVVNVAKGIEKDTLLRMSEIAYEVMPEIKYVALSGPSHAEEVGKGLPTIVAVASKDRELANYAQDIFITERFRVYTSDDLIGVELGGALKNIIALGAGISDGMKFGDNAKAALMTRGIAEITRLGVALGADATTFAGLTGIGDLIVTCTSMHSRNRRCGIMLGEGMSLEQAVEEIGMVVEGVSTVEAAYQLAKKIDVEMPITEQIYKVIKGNATAKEAVEVLMGRDRKHEQE